MRVFRELSSKVTLCLANYTKTKTKRNNQSIEESWLFLTLNNLYSTNQLSRLWGKKKWYNAENNELAEKQYTKNRK